MSKTKSFSTIKNDFPFFKQHSELVFFDSAATSLKPKIVLDAVADYYENYSVNSHTTDFPLALATKAKYESAREDVAKFINGQQDEVVFCPSTTFALNQIAYSLGEFLQANDEIVLTSSEHSSLLLPFYRLAQEKKVNLKFVPIASDGLITPDNLKKVLSKKTKVVAFANMNNSLGTINDAAELTKVVKNFAIESDAKWPFEKAFVVVDGAQAIAHIPTDVSAWGIDFFAFSAHKLFGPTGIAGWWTKKAWLDLLQPLILGGGMNGRIYQDGRFTLLDGPERFEGGTPNLAGVFGMQAAIKYVAEIGMAEIHNHEKILKEYAISEFKKHFGDKVVIFNEEQPSGILLFNVVNVAAEDVASYLGQQGIALRSGNFCAKLIADVIKCPSSLRVSLSIYNDQQDIDRLVQVLAKGFAEGGDFLNELFN